MQADARARTLALLDGIDDRAKDAAFALFTLAPLSVHADAVNHLVSNLFCIAGLIPAIRGLLRVDAPSPVITPEQNNHIFHYAHAICRLLQNIENKIADTGRWIPPLAAEPEGGFYPLNELQNARRLFEACFDTFAVIITAARLKGLEEIGSLTQYQTLEKLRLREALARPAYKAMPLSPFGTVSTSAQPPALGPSLPSFSLTTSDEQQTQTVPASSDITPTGTPVMTPESTRNNTPTGGGHPGPSNLAAEAPPSAGQPDASDPASSPPTEAMFSLSLEDSEKLELYLLRPVPEKTSALHAVQVTYKIYPIAVQHSEIMAHIKTLPSTYSVLSSLEQLLPDELRLVLEHANRQKGTIVSVKRANDVEEETVMGTLKLRSFLFVMKTPPLAPFFKRGLSAPQPTAKGFQSESQHAPQNPFAGAEAAPATIGFPSHGLAFNQAKDATGCLEQYQAISTHPAYQNYSFEELRLKDYIQAESSGAPLQPPSGLFATPPANSAAGFGTGSRPGLFGQNHGAQSGGFGHPATSNEARSDSSSSTVSPCDCRLFCACKLPSDELNKTARPGSGFGGLFSTSGGAGGNTTSGGLFGGLNTAAREREATHPGSGSGSGSSLFGRATGQSAGGLFGSNTGQSAGGLFGSNTGQSGSGLFGSNTGQSGSGLFGSNIGQSGSGLFGSNTGQSGVSLFGNSTNHSGASLFGNNTNRSGGGLFGSNTRQTSSLFSDVPINGTNTTGAFGGNTRQTPSLFSGAVPASNALTGTLFGNAPAQPASNAPTGTLFGNIPAQPAVSLGVASQPQPVTATGPIQHAATVDNGNSSTKNDAIAATSAALEIMQKEAAKASALFSQAIKPPAQAETSPKQAQADEKNSDSEDEDDL